MTDRLFIREDSLMQIPQARGTLLMATTTIPFRGYEISISLNNRSTLGDLCEGEIRVFKGREDVSARFTRTNDASAGELLAIMSAINAETLPLTMVERAPVKWSA